MSTGELFPAATAAVCFVISGFLYTRGGSLIPERKSGLDLTARLLGIAGFVLMIWVVIHAFPSALEFEPSVR